MAKYQDRIGWGDDDLNNVNFMTPEQMAEFERNRATLQAEIKRTDDLLVAAGVDPNDPEFGLDVLGDDVDEENP